jgi:hypothetical protein
MDTVSEADKVEILRTRNDALMVRYRGVQVSKVLPIVCHHSPALSTGVSQHGFVRELLLGFSCVLYSQHVVP